METGGCSRSSGTESQIWDEKATVSSPDFGPESGDGFGNYGVASLHAQQVEDSDSYRDLPRTSLRPCRQGKYRENRILYTHSLQLPDAQILEDFCTKQKVRLEAIYLTAWTVLLQRYTGQEDVCFAFNVQEMPGHAVFETSGVWRPNIISSDPVVATLERASKSYKGGLSRVSNTLDNQIHKRKAAISSVTNTAVCFFDRGLNVREGFDNNDKPGNNAFGIDVSATAKRDESQSMSL